MQKRQKDLKSKNFREKKVLKLAKDIDKKKFKSKPKKFRLERPIFLGHPNSGSYV